MNAPDKIYINNYNGNDTWGNQWHSKPSQSPSIVSHEYIRKDALLEWAKKELESAEITNFDEFGRGEVIAWKHVLDKLNSM